MKKYAFYISTLLVVACLSCSKTNNQASFGGRTGEGGYYISLLTPGPPNIRLTKNTDTTITVPIAVYVLIEGNWTAIATVSFGSMPSDVVSVTPLSASSTFSNIGGKSIDTFIFHIYAIDTGTFPIVVMHSQGSGEQAPYDTFHIIVH